MPEDRLDPARLIQELKSIKLGFDSIRQPMSDSHLAYTFYEALPEEYRAFKMLYSQQTADIGNFEFDDTSARAAAFYSFQLRNKKLGNSRENEQALATKVHGGLRSMKGELKPSFDKYGNAHRGHQGTNSNQLDARSGSADGLDRLGNCAYCHGRNHRASECRRRTCNYCRRPGHVISECRLKQRHEGGTEETNSNMSAASAQRVHASQAHRRTEDEDQMAWCSLITEDNRRADDNIGVYLDSAATMHMVDGDSELGRLMSSTRE